MNRARNEVESLVADDLKSALPGCGPGTPLCVLLGFYLADSSVAPSIDDLTRDAARLVSSICI
ncbi:hypothetical protein [Streptomyces sp. NPDC007083]|uniref:hypothetical protein n=1 Tax=Streptomyces sp. NPDC007083 TaxID=3156913 RepID=UPI00340E65BF